ncbi:MAG: hypothetical protein IH840_16310, partial [Candidatus Heimdallarchaeota archaeon]|nr:hypothetical protein [Candidatus Heimdallarchaeota archaeon]
GLLAGVVYGQAGKGQLNSLIVILLLYTVNSIANVVEEIQTLNKANPLNWYTPSDVFFGHDIETDLIVKLLLVIFITGILAVLAYNKRDLVENSPFLSLSLRRNKRGDDQSDIPKVKSNKNSFFTFWVKPLERKYPILADFVYSERRVLLITFIALTLFYPLQLMTYDEETITKIITDFGDIPLFTYGHLINDQPYLWFLTTQAVGVHWMYFVPLMLHWIKKIVSWDAEGGTGEIIGVQLVKRSDVVFQRTLAVGLEIIWIVVIEVIYLIISETVVDATLGLSWEILAITGKISLYYFLLVLTVGISFYLPQYKSLGGRLLFLTIFASFVIGISSESTDNIFTRGIFGLYDPVLIMRDQTFTAIIGILVLAILILPGILFLKSQSEKFEWINT